MQRRLSCLHDLVSDHTSWISPATLFEVIDGIASKDHCIGREEERPVVPDSAPPAEVVEKHIFDHVTVQVAADQAESDEGKKAQVAILSRFNDWDVLDELNRNIDQEEKHGADPLVWIPHGRTFVNSVIDNDSHNPKSCQARVYHSRWINTVYIVKEEFFRHASQSVADDVTQ